MLLPFAVPVGTTIFADDYKSSDYYKCSDDYKSRDDYKCSDDYKSSD